MKRPGGDDRTETDPERCAAAHPTRGEAERPVSLRALPGGASAGGPDGSDAVDPEPDDVSLVREFKGPLVDGLLRADAAVDLLPGRVRAVLETAESGDLPTANELLDRAVADVLPGPGFGQRRLGRALWLALAVAASLLAIWTAAVAWAS